MRPSEDDLLRGEGRVWLVVGGEPPKNGIMVRFDESFTSKVQQEAQRIELAFSDPGNTEVEHKTHIL